MWRIPRTKILASWAWKMLHEVPYSVPLSASKSDHLVKSFTITIWGIVRKSGQKRLLRIYRRLDALLCPRSPVFSVLFFSGKLSSRRSFWAIFSLNWSLRETALTENANFWKFRFFCFWPFSSKNEGQCTGFRCFIRCAMKFRVDWVLAHNASLLPKWLLQMKTIVGLILRWNRLEGKNCLSDRFWGCHQLSRPK